MRKNHSLGFIMALLLSMSLFSACSSDSEEEILQPVSKHIIGKWEMTAGYLQYNGKWEEHDVPESPRARMTYDFLDNGSLVICTTDVGGWSVYSTIPYKINDTKVTFAAASPESTVELLSADSLVMVSYFLHNPDTGEELTEPLPYKWSFRRLASRETTLGDKLIGKWKFTKTEVLKEGAWVVSTEETIPQKTTMEILASDESVIEDVIDGETHRHGFSWRINNSDGTFEMHMGEDSRTGRVEFEGNEKMWLYRSRQSADGRNMELRDGWIRIM